MKDFKIYMIVASLLIVVYVVAQYNRPMPVNWTNTLYYKDKIPFGTYILHDQLPQLFPKAKVVNTNSTFYEQMTGDKLSAGNYLIISKGIDMSKLDYGQMLNYIRQGNSVFIATFGWSGALADTLKLQEAAELSEKQSAQHFTNPQLDPTDVYTFKKNTATEYFSRFDTAHAVVLTMNANGKSTMLRFQFGKGFLYLSANPDLFTNFTLLSQSGNDYASKVLSYLPQKQTIYWDEYQNGDIPIDESPLRVLFSKPAFVWAYYISLVSLLVFIFYEMKRRQRIIPIIEPVKNTTVEFVNVVGQVYYEQRDNSNIVRKKITYFLEHLRTRYYLKTSVLDRDFIEGFWQKTGIDKSFAAELVNHINYLNVQTRVSDNELITLNQQIEKFYHLTA